MPHKSTASTPSVDAVTRIALGPDPACECMVCDLPLGVSHGAINWNVVLWFPGPYPKPGEVDMLLCDHCKNDWVHGEWDPPYDNFIITQCTPV